jgi:hypothetical protein
VTTKCSNPVSYALLTSLAPAEMFAESRERCTENQFLSTIRKDERASYNGSIEASQASDVGSIPIARSIIHGSNPDTWVTERTGHIGNTSEPKAL